MRRTLSCLIFPAVLSLFLAGCGSNSTTMSTGTPAAGTAPVSISMTDDPPVGVQVLFFQVSLTSATLTPQSGPAVSLLSGGTPIQVDVTQLQALSAFLSTADVAPGTYTGMNLTFSDPQLVIFNAADASLGSQCPVGNVCELAPKVSGNDSVSLTTTPFPATVSANSPLGFLVDFHLNTVIQSDLSVNLGATNGVTVSALPTAPTVPQFGSITGTVGTVDASKNTFSLQTEWGMTFTIDASSSTTFSGFPMSACASASFSCVAQGQVVKVQVASIASGSVLNAGQVAYQQQVATDTADGIIIGVTPSSGGTPTGFQMILHGNWGNNSNFPLGGEATVTLGSGATFGVDSNGFTMPTGAASTFSGAPNLTVGQDVKVTMVQGSLSNNGGGGQSNNGWGPPQSVSFTASNVELEPSQVTGWVTGVDSSMSSFTLGIGLSQIFAPWPVGVPSSISFNVVTSSGTTFTGLNPNNFSGIANNDFISVNGWLFAPTSSGGTPNIVAQSVVQRANMGAL